MSDTEHTSLPGTGIVRVSADIIRDWLLLPEGLDIVNAQMEDNGHTIMLTVQHREASFSPDGVALPFFMPVFQTKRDEDGIAWHRLLEIKVGEVKGFPIVIDPTLPEHVIQMGDTTIYNIASDEAHDSAL